MQLLQKRAGLPVTGEIDDETLAALDTAEPLAPAAKDANLAGSRTVQGSAVAGTIGFGELAQSASELKDQLTEAQAQVSAGTVFGLIVGGLIVAGALYALYARWDDAGRPVPGFLARRFPASPERPPDAQLFPALDAARLPEGAAHHPVAGLDRRAARRRRHPRRVGFGFTALPARWKLPAIVLSAGLIALGGLWQLAEAEGRKKVLIRAHTIALQAETIRADIAEQTTREIGAQAVRDAEAHELALQAKKEVEHAADVHPDRDRVAVPRDLARGLRALQRSGAH